MTSKKVLGRGLGAFFPDYDEMKKGDTNHSEGGGAYYPVKPGQKINMILQVPVENVRPNPRQPRKEFDEEGLKELAQSIEKHGLIQPITVRDIGENRFELISGERRLRASRLAGVKKLPAYIREVDDEDILSFALVENIQREDLNPIEIALGYRRLIDEAGLTQAEAAGKVGKNRSTVANMLRLLNLPPYIQAALRDQQISMGHARTLINIEDEDEQRLIFQKIVDKGYSVRQAEKAVRALANKQRQAQHSSPASTNGRNEAFFKEITSRLRRTLSTKVRVKPKKKGGEIRIEFYSDDELERLLELFESIS